MATFLFDKINRIITVVPTTATTIQELINTIRNWEAGLENLETAKIADASGKEDLGGGLLVGITLKLFNWKLKFDGRPGPDWVDCGISGGNLVAVDGVGQPMNPIQPSAYVTVTVAKAVSAASLQEANIPLIKAKTDLLPSDPAGLVALASAHGSGSWEGATPTQLWGYTNRRLTSRNIDSGIPGESLPSEEQVRLLKEPEGDGYNAKEDSLKRLSDKLDELIRKIRRVTINL